MLGRLANVIYWVCTGLAVLCAIGAVAALPHGDRTDYFGSIFLAVLAVICFGVGRAVKYVVLGK